MQKELSSAEIIAREDHPAEKLILKEYQRAYQYWKEFYARIDDWRGFFDEVIYKNQGKVGGQIMIPQLRKLYRGMNHPDGLIKRNEQLSAQEVILAESFVRQELERHQVAHQWKNRRQKSRIEGVLYHLLKINPKTGESYSEMVGAKSMMFDPEAENIHPLGDERGANWMFQTETHELEIFRGKFTETCGKAVVDQVRSGSPLDRQSPAQRVEGDPLLGQEQPSDKPVTTIYVTCLKSPISFSVRVKGQAVRVKKGEPFSGIMSGSNKVWLQLYAGEQYPWRWAHTQEAFFPVVAYFDTGFRKGLQALSFMGVAKPYVEKISHLEESMDRNVEMIANQDYILNFSRQNPSNKDGDHSIHKTQQWIAYNMKKKLEGSRRGNIIMTQTDQGVDLDAQSVHPVNLDIGAVETRVARLKQEFSDIVGILHNDISYDDRSKVGILKYKEEEQNGAVASYQELNESHFELFNRMLLNTLLVIPSAENSRKITVKDSKIDFAYETPLDEVRKRVSAKVLFLEWKFAFSRPEGAVAAAAETEAFERMEKLMAILGPLPTLKKAMLDSQAKIISLDKSTDAFSVEEAIADLERMPPAAPVAA